MVQAKSTSPQVNELQESVCLLQGGPALSDSKALACKGRWVLGDDKGQVLGTQALPALAELSMELRFGQLVLADPAAYSAERLAAVVLGFWPR